MGCREPEVYVRLPQLPLLPDRFLYPGAYLFNVLPAELVRKARACRDSKDKSGHTYSTYARSDSGSRSVIRFDEKARSRRHTGKRSAQAPVAGPRSGSHSGPVNRSGGPFRCHSRIRPVRRLPRARRQWSRSNDRGRQSREVRRWQEQPATKRRAPVCRAERFLNCRRCRIDYCPGR